MIDYDDKELQRAAERLQGFPEFQLVIEALQDEYRATAFSSAPDDVTVRETCYQRHSMLDELKTVVEVLKRTKEASEKRYVRATN